MLLCAQTSQSIHYAEFGYTREHMRSSAVHNVWPPGKWPLAGNSCTPSRRRMNLQSNGFKAGTELVKTTRAINHSLTALGLPFARAVYWNCSTKWCALVQASRRKARSRDQSLNTWIRARSNNRYASREFTSFVAVVVGFLRSGSVPRYKSNSAVINAYFMRAYAGPRNVGCWK